MDVTLCTRICQNSSEKKETKQTQTSYRNAKKKQIKKTKTKNLETSDVFVFFVDEQQ